MNHFKLYVQLVAENGKVDTFFNGLYESLIAKYGGELHSLP